MAKKQFDKKDKAEKMEETAELSPSVESKEDISTPETKKMEETATLSPSVESDVNPPTPEKEETIMAEEQKTASEVTTEEPVIVKEVPQEDLDRVVRHHVYTSMAVGLVPLPVVDFVGIAGIQLNLIRKLAKMYGVKFSKSTVKNILAALIGGAAPAAISPPLAFSSMKFIPLVGQSVGAVTMPVISGASTYAIGKVFIRHFSAGGTFLTFDAEKVKDYYRAMFKEGKKVAEETKVAA